MTLVGTLFFLNRDGTSQQISTELFASATVIDAFAVCIPLATSTLERVEVGLEIAASISGVLTVWLVHGKAYKPALAACCIDFVGTFGAASCGLTHYLLH